MPSDYKNTSGKMLNPSTECAYMSKTEESHSNDTVTVFEARRNVNDRQKMRSQKHSERCENSSESTRMLSTKSSSSGGSADAFIVSSSRLEDPSSSSKSLAGTAVSRSATSSYTAMTKKSLREQLYILFVLLAFAGSSLGAIFINKTCLTGYNFKYPLTLILGQMVFAIAILSLLHVLNYKKIRTIQRHEIPMMAIPTILFACNVGVGLSALSLVNIPMFSAFRRLTLLFVMGAEYVLLRKTYSPGIVNSVIAMAFGAFISAIDDVTFSRLGYFLVFLNNICTALYLASIKKVMKESDFQPLSLLFYTALLGFPLVAALMFLTGEFKQVISAFQTRPDLMTPAFGVSLLLTASGAFAVNFSTSLCTQVTSPLTTSVAGQVKNVLQTVLGFFSWGFEPTFMNMFGLLVALGAQIVFAYLKYKENKPVKSDENR